MKYFLYPNGFWRILDKLSNDIQVDKLLACDSIVLMFKLRGIIRISKIEFFNFSGTERVKKYDVHSKMQLIMRKNYTWIMLLLALMAIVITT